jgi:hypothetical protein
MRSLAKAHVVYRAHMLFGFFVGALLGKSEEIKRFTGAGTNKLLPKSSRDVLCLLRLLGSVSKATTAKAAVMGAQAATEFLGGVGYLENDEMEFNIARLLRDMCAICIGEGTTDVLATDVVKVLKGKIGSSVVNALGDWVKAKTPRTKATEEYATTVLRQWNELESAIVSNSFDHLPLNAREITDHVCKVVCGVLLLADAVRDENEVAVEVARRWITTSNSPIRGVGGARELFMDQKIVFGDQPIWLAGP